MWCVVNTALVTHNAALNRPAYQSSLYTDGRGDFIASLANDGDLETNAVRDGVARCSHSLNETNPWWAVDLGKPTAVYRVDLTHRGAEDTGMY